MCDFKATQIYDTDLKTDTKPVFQKSKTIVTKTLILNKIQKAKDRPIFHFL